MLIASRLSRILAPICLSTVHGSWEILFFALFFHAGLQPLTSWKKQYPRAPTSRSTSEWSGDLPACIRTQSLRLRCAGKPASGIVARRNVGSLVPR
jgi:hypothetical protein